MAKRRYFNQTTGLGHVPRYILPNAYTGAADYEAFINTGNIGDFAVIDPDTKAVISTALAPGDRFQLAQIIDVDGIDFRPRVMAKSPMVFDPECAKFCAYTAPVNQTFTIQISSPATQKGQAFGIRLHDVTEVHEFTPSERYEFVSVTGAETAADIAAGIKANYDLMEARYNSAARGVVSMFDITVAGDTLTVTTKDPWTRFNPTVYENNRDAVITETVAWVSPVGTYEQVYQSHLEGDVMEDLKIDKVHIGDFWGKLRQFVDEGCTYDWFYICEKREERQGAYPNWEPRQYKAEIVLHADTATGPSAALRTIFGL